MNDKIAKQPIQSVGETRAVEGAKVQDAVHETGNAAALKGEHAYSKTAPRKRALGVRRMLRHVLRPIKRTLLPIRTGLMRLVAGSPFLSSVHFALINRAFGREHQATLCGRLRYEKELIKPAATSPLLRRNVHRLEKGILMRPRRTPFALEYIQETVDIYKRSIGQGGIGNEELQWAHDVLERYFQVNADEPATARLKELFESLPLPIDCVNQATAPYYRELNKPLSVAYEDLLALAIRRRSVRWFLQKPVPRELIDQAIRVAALSPSACNRQPFLFRVIDDRNLLLRVASVPMGTAGYKENIPALVVVVGQMRNFFSERDRHLIYIDGALASMSFAFAIESLGLSSCMINWPDIDERERQMATLLQLDKDERPIMLIAVGYADPDGLVAASVKKPLEQLRKYNS